MNLDVRDTDLKVGEKDVVVVELEMELSVLDVTSDKVAKERSVWKWKCMW